MTSSKN